MDAAQERAEAVKRIRHGVGLTLPVVLAGAMTVGSLYAFLAYVGRFFEPINDLSSKYNSMQAAMAGGERVYELLDTPPAIQDRPGAQVLPAIDDLKLALANVPADLAGHVWPQGIALIGQKLESILQRQGLEQIGSEGDRFDPHIHEAVAYEEHPVYDEGQVASVYRVGYRLNDRVLRPAQVVVARGSSRPPASAGGDSRTVGAGTAHP